MAAEKEKIVRSRTVSFRDIHNGCTVEDSVKDLKIITKQKGKQKQRRQQR